MEKKDFEKLKAVLEKEGFEINPLPFTDDKDDNIAVIIQKKDIWEGVEFVENTYKGGIKKVRNIGDTNIVLENGNILFKSNAKPSTESEYVEQLKKEAFERFGDVGKLSLLKNANGDLYPPDLSSASFQYIKDEDCVFQYDIMTYRKGKWAEKVEKIKVIPYIGPNAYVFSFKINTKINDYDNISQYLAEQLENYLNEKRT